MLTPYQRPNFFPGQLIDYQDFNRLSGQADRLNSLLCRYLFSEGGIVLSSLKEFEISPLKGTTCLIKTGIGLLPTGQPVVLTEDRVIDLSPYCMGKKNQQVVVSLRNVVQGMDKFVDDADPAITGYRSEAFIPEVVMTADKPAEDAIELFRITLKAQVDSIRLPEADEEWMETIVPDESHPNVAVIDLRSRRSIVPQNLFPLSAMELVSLRKALYQLQDSHRKLMKVFFVEDPFDSQLYLSQLHTEVLSRPFQPLKMAFLTSEFAEKLSHFLEHVATRAKKGAGNFDRDSYLKTITTLESLKSRTILPRQMNLMDLVGVATHLENIVNYAEAKFNLLTNIEEAILDFKDRSQEFENTLTLAGHIFNQVDRVSIDDPKRLMIRAESPQKRRAHASFRNGDELQLPGVFLRDGSISLTFKAPSPERPVIILTNQYVRRSGSVIHYEINGKHLATDKWDKTDYANNWINKGLAIPAEYLVAQENRIQIRVEKSDLDFGFFGVTVYQPSVLREVTK